MTDHESEVWRAIPDWESLYSVSNRGRIRSEPRDVYRPGICRGYRVRGRVLRPNAAGTVNLSRPGARRSVNCRSIAAYVFGRTPANSYAPEVTAAGGDNVTTTGQEGHLPANITVANPQVRGLNARGVSKSPIKATIRDPASPL